MDTETRRRRVLVLLANLLDYPQPNLEQSARECAALVTLENPRAAQQLFAFADWCSGRTRGELEELYTRLFELNPICALHVGYHLLGESYKRSLFLLGLKERYQSEGFDSGSELPDHLAVMLRYCALADDRASADEMLREAISPVLEKLVILPEQQAEDVEASGLDGPGGYGSILQTLKLIIADWAGLPVEVEAKLC